MKRENFKIGWIILLLIFVHKGVFAQSYLQREDQWVKEKMSKMTLDQKIGQLFMVRVNSKANPLENKVFLDYIKKYQVGGVCFFQGNPVEQARMVNIFQNQATIPLFVGIDAEWGLGMRFPKDAISFPKQLLLGAIQDNKLIYEMGKEIADQCRAIGVNVNFAPSVDINSNPKNPIIYDRSFGESSRLVTEKGYMYMKGLEDNGVLACVKHFPGHGDTDVDSHKDLPVINKSMEELDKNELFPFRRLLSQRVGAVMVGHLHLPQIDERPNHPATLSDKLIKDVLRKDLSYDGLVFTDAMDMQAITRYFPNGTAEAEAFLAGNDVILLPSNLENAINAIKKYMIDGLITTERLDESVERILRTKYKLDLNFKPVINETGIPQILNSNKAIAISQRLTSASVTLLKNDDNLVPIVNIVDRKIATLSVNSGRTTVFQQRADSYISPHHYQVVPSTASANYSQLLTTLSQFDVVIVGIHTSGKQNDFTKDLPDDVLQLLKNLQRKTKVIITLFGSPYLLDKLNFASNLLVNYDNDAITQDMTMQAIFGVTNIDGHLPVSVGTVFSAGAGLEKASLLRLGYSLPEAVGIHSDKLMKIDSIVNAMIAVRATPGAQVLVAKGGKIILQKAYGKLSEDGYYVSNNSIYDVASITKILATTLSVMKLVDERRINIHNPIRYYIPGIDTTDKAELKVEEILAHQSGLSPWIGFYKSTLPAQGVKGYNPLYYSTILKEDYRIPIAKAMFMRADYIDTMYQKIWVSPLNSTKTYKYSDLGFMIMQKIVQYQGKRSLDVFTDQNFYKPLGLRHTTFNPLVRFAESEIVPSEIDNYWRMQTVKGYVHDMAAAMLGGVSGHAGLFSTSYDMAVLMQMLLNKGAYGGVQYIQPETVQLFTTRYNNGTRRGLGLDMKEMNTKKTQNVSKFMSNNAFGHTGFTGCEVWADPDHDLVYIFNTNRTYPGRNQIFTKGDYRTKIQDCIYKSLY